MAAGASSDPRPPSGPAPGRPGSVVLVVGPSGAGKDSVLAHARERLAADARFVFPKRVVTRAADASEDHDSLTLAAFAEVAARGGFALDWHAHGHRYGIPVAIDGALAEGRTVVFNASRLVVPAARQRYAAAVVLIDAPLEVRAARLAARDREPPDEVAARMRRVVTGFSAADADLTIDNGGALRDAVAALVAWLRARAPRSGAPPPPRG